MSCANWSQKHQQNQLLHFLQQHPAEIFPVLVMNLLQLRCSCSMLNDHASCIDKSLCGAAGR